MSPSARLVDLALAAPIVAADDATSQRILDAALHVAAASGVRHLTMDDVAARAGVGRMTVYRRFGDKRRLTQALAAREAQRCLAELDAAASPDDPITEQIAAAFVTSLRIAREHPLLRRLARLEPEALLYELRGDGGALFAIARAATEERLREAQRGGTLGPVAVEPAAELLVRLALSFSLIEDSALPLDDEPKLRQIARDMVAPILTATAR